MELTNGTDMNVPGYGTNMIEHCSGESGPDAC